MSITQNGMLFVASDVSAADEADFNDWYDREHVEERARIPGFISAARYQSVKGGRSHLGLYRTESLETFTSPAYKKAFGQQTDWSVTNLNRMLRPMRRVCAVTPLAGQGSGSWLSVLPLGPGQSSRPLADLAGEIATQLAKLPGFVRSCLLVPDVVLSSPLPKEALEGRQLLPMLVIETSGPQANETALKEASRLLNRDESHAAQYTLKWKLFSKELN